MKVVSISFQIVKRPGCSAAIRAYSRSMMLANQSRSNGWQVEQKSTGLTPVSIFFTHASQNTPASIAKPIASSITARAASLSSFLFFIDDFTFPFTRSVLRSSSVFLILPAAPARGSLLYANTAFRRNSRGNRLPRRQSKEPCGHRTWTCPRHPRTAVPRTP